MPYELRVTLPIKITDHQQYINPCCVGGDVVMNQLLPFLREQYDEVQTDQEDWGWFAWFSESGVELGVDIFCDNPGTGEFKIHLTSHVRRMFFKREIVDTPALDVLRERVLTALGPWIGKEPRIVRLDTEHMPIEEAT
jgi:hypothetical protein